MDRDGQSYFTLTPLREPWIYDMFFGDEDARMLVEKGAAHLYKNDYWSVTGSIWDNPYLTDVSIMRYLNELSDEDERECREKGIPLQFAGLIYKEFEVAVHVLRSLPDGWEDFDKPPGHWPVYLQLDPHPQTPCAALLTTVGPSGRKYTFNELWTKGVAESVVKDILDLVGFRNLVNPQCDPSAFNSDELSGTCWADDFGKYGLWFSKAPKELSRGIMAVKAALKDRLTDGTPSWMFSPYLRRFLWEIKRWNWNKENKPTDKNDHTMECLYRTVLSNPVYVEREANEKSVEDLAIVSGLDDGERWQKRNYSMN